jgi:hypothetical protein
MSQPVSKNNEPSKMDKLLNGRVDQSIEARLPRATGAPPPPKTPTPTTTASQVPAPKSSRYKFSPAFWTIASVISLTVNVVILIVLLVVLNLLGGPKATLSLAQDQATGLLGGLYQNFVKMDAASIKTTIHVEKEIPVQFTLNVSGPSDVTLSRDVAISGALVTVNTGGLNINNARANIVLPAGTVLPIFIQNLVVPVDQKVLAVLDVPVNIPLNQTELHDPFVGLQKVVEPYYCLLQPNTVVNGVAVCATAASIFPIPTSAETVAP